MEKRGRPRVPSRVLLSVVLVAGCANCMIAKGRNGTYARFGLSALQPNVHEPTKRYVDPTSNPIATGLVPADPGPKPPPRQFRPLRDWREWKKTAPTAVAVAPEPELPRLLATVLVILLGAPFNLGVYGRF